MDTDEGHSQTQMKEAHRHRYFVVAMQGCSYITYSYRYLGDVLSLAVSVSKLVEMMSLVCQEHRH